MKTLFAAAVLIVAGCAVAKTAEVPQAAKETPKAGAGGPTIGQCRADASRWAAQPISYKDWSVEVINSAMKEMLYCDTDYRNDSAHTQFAQLQHQLQDEIGARYQHFIDRHGLFSLFLEVDEKGER